MTMRVLFWSPSFWPRIGGAEVLAARLLPALRDRGHEFVVVADERPDSAPDHAEYAGIPIFRAPFLGVLAERNVDHLMRLQRMLGALKRDFQPDLVHNYFLGPSALFLQTTAKVHPAPCLVTLHLDLGASGHHLPVGPETLGRSTLLGADWVVACSAAVLGEARRLLPEIVPFSSAIPNALDCPALAPEPLPFDPPRLLCLGRLARQKGFDLAVQVLPELLSRFPSVRLIVAGDGDERAALQAQAATLGVVDAVDFLGWVPPDDVPTLINTCTVLL
ncbi:MAG: glycosyltransferase family 4 protein, partial [Chloroflexi bacterium]|nr:glycosyltransferase family 4 protein [Chloroflexota bacterium]